VLRWLALGATVFSIIIVQANLACSDCPKKSILLKAIGSTLMPNWFVFFENASTFFGHLINPEIL
jgi:hypothetical protein